MAWSGVVVARTSRSISSAPRPGALERRDAGLDGELGGGAAHAPLADAGALDDPLVGGVEARREVGVRDDLVGQGAAPAGDRRSHQPSSIASSQPGDRLAADDPFAGEHEDALQGAGERRADLHAARPPDEIADGDLHGCVGGAAVALAAGRRLAGAGPGGELRRGRGEGRRRGERSGGRRDDQPLGDLEALADLVLDRRGGRAGRGGARQRLDEGLEVGRRRHRDDAHLGGGKAALGEAR